MSFLRNLWYACAGFETYRHLFNLPLRSVLFYWSIFSAILSLVVLGNMLRYFDLAFPTILRVASTHLSEVTLQQGHASSPIAQPYIGNTNQFPIIIDTQNTITEPSKMFPQGVAVREKELFVWWVPGMKPLAQEWKTMPDGTLNSEYLGAWGSETRRRLPIALPILWLTIMLGGLLQAFFFTMLVGFVEKTMQPSFTFTQLFSIAVFAITPGAIVISIYSAIQFYEIRYDLLYFVCYCFFLVLASGACRTVLPGAKKETEQEEDTE
jgi:hypothetical protein